MRFYVWVGIMVVSAIFGVVLFAILEWLDRGKYRPDLCPGCGDLIMWDEPVGKYGECEACMMSTAAAMRRLNNIDGL